MKLNLFNHNKFALMGAEHRKKAEIFEKSGPVI